MSNKLNIFWIDDDPSRKKESESLGNRVKANIDFIDVEKHVLLDKLNEILSKQMPDLILMDHRLNNVKESGFETGSTAAEILREKWWDCPIVCITAVPLKDIDLHKQSIYEDVFEIEKVSEYDLTLLSIARSFQELQNQKKRLQDKDDFIRMLKAPEDDRVRLESILPQELKNKEFYQDESLLLNISRWVRHTLIAKPGFLYDRLWTATLLGIKEESFKKVEKIFEEAKYNGIFADESNERWWQSKLREIIFSQFPDSDSILPWELGRRLPDIEEPDFSKCHVSGEDYPETVAYTDEKAETRRPMRLRYTVPHPNFEKLLFFEEIRMMKGAE